MSAMPPNVLLAPTKAQDPMIPVEEAPEPLVKNAEVQTAYRESEAQTNPYTPDYFVPEGEDPDVLMLKDLTFENGLPLGLKDLRMVELAKAKRLLESSLPPFTDEASMNLRKRLMENQEMKEFKVREAEIDRRREERLETLREALSEREQANELLSSQRVDAIRQMRVEERDSRLTQIRSKRLKVLRGLARKRNAFDKTIFQGNERDIVGEYFDKASTLYAPIKREGQGVKPDPNKFDVDQRTAPLDNLQNIMTLEDAVPRSIISMNQRDGNSASPLKQMSKTEPLGTHNRVRASEPRKTSAAARSQRDIKRDIEEMHAILQRKKKAALLSQSAGAGAAGAGGHGLLHGASSGSRPHSRAPGSAPAAAGSAEAGIGSAGGAGSPSKHTTTTPAPPGSSPLSKPRGKSAASSRPRTPDLASQPDNASQIASQPLRAAVVLLQRLLRGRAVQNIMYEGRLRRSELIAELRNADEAAASEVSKTASELGLEAKAAREEAIRRTTIDAIGGLASSHLLNALASEKVRVFFLNNDVISCFLLYPTHSFVAAQLTLPLSSLFSLLSSLLFLRHG